MSFYKIYGIDEWCDGLVGVDESGKIILNNPIDANSSKICLPILIESLKKRGISMPVTLRVKQFLERSIITLNESFQDAFSEIGYKGDYRGVFPVKVNQQSEVVQHLSRFGKRYDFGFEVGSKPELIIALSQEISKDSLLICNGMKDDVFIKLAILSRKAGFNTIIVLESLKEFEAVEKISKSLGIKPLLGVRIKLTETVSGKWQGSSGDRSAFGMGALEVVELIKRLKETDLLDSLVLQHSHLGSQIPNIIDIRRAISEACRFYTELVKMGAPLSYLDLGGGLGIDYTGEKKPSENSINYTVEEYCINLAETVRYAMDEAGLKHPNIVTESGRYVVAQSSIFIFNILDTTLYDTSKKQKVHEDDHHLLSDLSDVEEYISKDRLQESLNDSVYYRDEIRALFRRKHIDLEQLARAENIFKFNLSKVKSISQREENIDEIENQLENFIDYYHGNFSLFQSLPDVWAIDQIHPIIPLQRMNEEPTRRAAFTDITCDSDGKIDRFILSDGISKSLPVHDLKENEDYYIGVFFVGAYQETLGDLHNLFGDANVVTVSFDPDGGYSIEHETEGDTIAEVLSYVEYNPQDCLSDFRKTVERAVKAGNLNADERRIMISAYKESLASYTYFE